MTQPYIGEIRMIGCNFAPQNWALCNGQSMSISDNTTLYTLIGTTYGGDGVNTFNLPNLQGRLGVGMGTGNGLSPYVIGQMGGTENVTLTAATLASHSHPLLATSTTATLGVPTNNLTGTAPSGRMYATAPTTKTGNLNAQSTTYTGGNQPHPNLMPSLCVTFIIALYGIFPSQS